MPPGKPLKASWVSANHPLGRNSMQEARPRAEDEGRASMLGGQGNRAGRTGLGKKPGGLRPGGSVRVGHCSLGQALGSPDRNERARDRKPRPGTGGIPDQGRSQVGAGERAWSLEPGAQTAFSECLRK